MDQKKEEDTSSMQQEDKSFYTIKSISAWCSSSHFLKSFQIPDSYLLKLEFIKLLNPYAFEWMVTNSLCFCPLLHDILIETMERIEHQGCFASLLQVSLY